MNIEDFIKEHFNTTGDRNIYGKEDLLEVCKVFGEYCIRETLKEASENAKINQEYFDDVYSYKTIDELEEKYSFISPVTDGDGELYGANAYEIKKESILNLQKQLEEKLL